jgi:excisionase family DNA binding protein
MAVLRRFAWLSIVMQWRIIQIATDTNNHHGGDGVQADVRAEGRSEVLLDQREAYRRLNVGYSTGVSLVMAGQLRSIKIGARRLIPVSALDEFVSRKLSEQVGGQDI